MSDLFMYLKRYANSKSDTTAIKNGEITISYKQLLECVKRFSGYLLEQGCRPGDYVMIMLQDQIDLIIVFLSTLYIDCNAFPVPSNLKEYELIYIKQKIEISLIVDNKTSVRAICSNYSPAKECKRDHATLCHMTSGSTGKNKFCIRTLQALTNEGLMYKSNLLIKRNDIILSLAPIYHSFALGAVCMASLVSGSCIYTLNHFSAHKVLSVLAAGEVTIMVGVPVMAKLLCISKMNSEEIRHNLRLVIMGAGAIDESLMDTFKKRFNIHLSSNYGSTETGGLTCRLDEVPLGSVGKPFSGVKIKVVGDDGLIRNKSCEGGLWVKSKAMLKQYLFTDKEYSDKEGYFPMHDRVKIDSEGNLYIIGRLKNLINIGGKKVDPNEVQLCISSMEEVEDCVVVGIEENNKEIVVAFIVQKIKSLSQEKIRDYCRKSLMDYKMPSRIYFVRSIPKNELGKTIKEELHKLIIETKY